MGTRMKPKRQHPEKALQKTCAEFLARALPKNAYFSSIPGGEGRATRTPGYASGCCDIFVLYSGRFFGFELKAKYRKPTPEQKKGAEAVRRAGGWQETIYSVKELQALLRIYDVPLRAKISA